MWRRIECCCTRETTTNDASIGWTFHALGQDSLDFSSSSSSASSFDLQLVRLPWQFGSHSRESATMSLVTCICRASNLSSSKVFRIWSIEVSYKACPLRKDVSWDGKFALFIIRTVGIILDIRLTEKSLIYQSTSSTGAF